MSNNTIFARIIMQMFMNQIKVNDHFMKSQLSAIDIEEEEIKGTDIAVGYKVRLSFHDIEDKLGVNIIVDECLGIDLDYLLEILSVFMAMANQDKYLVFMDSENLEKASKLLSKNYDELRLLRTLKANVEDFIEKSFFIIGADGIKENLRQLKGLSQEK